MTRSKLCFRASLYSCYSCVSCWLEQRFHCGLCCDELMVYCLLDICIYSYTLSLHLWPFTSTQLAIISVPEPWINTIYGFTPTWSWWDEVSYVLELVFIVIDYVVSCWEAILEHRFHCSHFLWWGGQGFTAGYIYTYIIILLYHTVHTDLSLLTQLVIFMFLIKYKYL